MLLLMAQARWCRYRVGTSGGFRVGGSLVGCGFHIAASTASAPSSDPRWPVNATFGVELNERRICGVTKWVAAFG
jgi:hypothetical protein